MHEKANKSLILAINLNEGITWEN